MLIERLALRTLLLLAALTLFASTVFGQEFPVKPIRIIASAPGGGSDFTARRQKAANAAGAGLVGSMSGDSPRRGRGARTG